MDVSFRREMSQHVICAPDLARWATEMPSKFKGRILSTEDLTILEQALRLASNSDEKVLVFDISRIADRLKALKRGVKRTPTAIIDGKKYEKVEEILQALNTISNKPHQ
jgi:hypothetical protein